MLFIIMMEVFSRTLKRVEGVGLLQFSKLMVGRTVGKVFHISCLQMIQLFFVMQKRSKSFIYGCCFFVFKM